MPTVLLTKGLTAPAAATPRRTVKLAPEGLVTAIVAVTGVVDAVQDLIVPGAFTYTLTVRRPKVVDDHEWKNKVGRVLHAEEWLPGDPRLPAKTKDGKPWPAAAGALVATMQYNLNAERGREAYEWVRFYAESNEAEFSIGYKVPDGKARKRRDGVRVILMVDLFEFSHVLFGAAPLSMALEVKSMHGGTGGQVTRPALGASEETDDYDDVDTPDPDAPWDDTEPKRRRRARREVKTAAALVLEAKEGGADRNRGNAEDLRRWFLAGAGGQIAWGADGDFRACVSVASKHMTVEQARGYCQLRHKEATGLYTGDAEHLEGKSANQEVKAMSRMKGSYEERIALLEAAAGDLLATTLNTSEDKVCVCAVATYATEAVFSAWADGEQGNYLIPYQAHEDGSVSLGEPEKVELSLVAEPVSAAETVEAAAGDEPEPEQVVVDLMLGPVNRLVAGEGKAAEYARESLWGMLQAKGGPGYGHAEEDDDMADDTDQPAEDAESTGGAGDPADDLDTPNPAEGAEAPAEDLEDDAEEDTGTVTVDPEEHFALMDELEDEEGDEED